MEYNFLDIRTLTANAFVGKSYPEFLTKKLLVASEIDINTIGRSSVKTDIGTEYFMDLAFTLPSGEKLRLPHEPLVKFGFRKRIIKTYPTGGKRRGSVKEFISAGDWDIVIQGVCIDPRDPNSYPTEQVNIVKKLQEVNDAMEIDNDLLNFFGIYKIVIEASAFDEMKGVPGAQKYVFNAISDEDFYAELENEDLRGL